MSDQPHPNSPVMVTEDVIQEFYPAGVTSRPSTKQKFVKGQVVPFGRVQLAIAEGVEVPWTTNIGSNQVGTIVPAAQVEALNGRYADSAKPNPVKPGTNEADVQPGEGRYGDVTSTTRYSELSVNPPLLPDPTPAPEDAFVGSGLIGGAEIDPNSHPDAPARVDESAEGAPARVDAVAVNQQEAALAAAEALAAEEAQAQADAENAAQAEKDAEAALAADNAAAEEAAAKAKTSTRKTSTRNAEKDA